MSGPTTGGDMRQQTAREFFLIAANRKAQDHANVTPLTLQLGRLDRLDAA
jgi:hypothetical protein